MRTVIGAERMRR